MKELKSQRKEILYKQRTKLFKNLNSRKSICFFVGVFGLVSLLMFHRSMGLDSGSLTELIYAWSIGVSIMAGIWGIGNMKEKEMYLKNVHKNKDSE